MKTLIAILVLLFSYNAFALTLNCSSINSFNEKSQRIIIIDNKDQLDEIIRTDGQYYHPYGYVTDGKLISILHDGTTIEEEIAIINRDWNWDNNDVFFMDGFTVNSFEKYALATKYFSVRKTLSDNITTLRLFYPGSSFVNEGTCTIN